MLRDVSAAVTPTRDLNHWRSASTSVMSAIGVPQIADRLPVAPLILLATGGVLYSVGAVVYALKRPDPWPRTFGFHEVFHALVVAAAVVHFVAMAGWVVPFAAG